MAYFNTSSSFSGQSNQGFQVGSNSGHIIYNQPAYPQPQLLPCSTVPFRRDPDFIDRDVLGQILQKSSEPAARVALVGLGGVGKSQLAIEYSYRLREESPDTWVFWVHAGSPSRFEEGYRKIAGKVKAPGWDDPKANILQSVSNWLCDETHGHWTMILDNADDLEVFFNSSGKQPTGDLCSVQAAESLSDFLPNSPNGSILITSRSQEVAFRLTGNDRDIAIVNPMGKAHALALLQKKLKGNPSKEDMIELLQALDYMPLAITQAAAYINQRAPRITVATYLAYLGSGDRARASLLEIDVGDTQRDNSASNSVIATWHISFEHIRRQKSSAARLLSLMSFFDRQGIPEDLLHDCEDRGIGVAIDLDFEEDVFTLRSYSLIGVNLEDGMFEMHRLVQFSMRKWLELHEELETWKEKYIMIIDEAFPTGAYENWTKCQGLFPHAEIVLAYRPANGEYIVQWTNILDKAAWYAILSGMYTTAENMTREALDGRGKILGKEHPTTMSSVHSLASVLHYQGKYEEAENMHRQALNEIEKVLGKKHPDTLMSVHNLATVLQDQGKHEEAEKMYRQALNESEKVLGKKHPDTLMSVSNLALVLQHQGKYEEAEKMNRQALNDREKVLGKKHPDTLMSVSNLASVLQDQGKHEEAEKMYRQALNEIEKVLGKKHPDTLMSVSNLALVLHCQGKYEEAEKMYRQALNDREKVLGKKHPDTLMSVSNLALVLQDQGKYEEAEKMNRQALTESEKVLGKKHPDTLMSVSNLASVLHCQGKYEEAEKMYRQALNESEKVLGKKHPDTLMSVSNLASVLQHQGKHEEAEEMYRQALNEIEKVLGKKHPDTLMSVSNLALVLQHQGKYEEAEEMYRQVLNGMEKALGKEHPDTLSTVYLLAYLLHRQKDYQNALPYYQRACAGREKVLGSNHPKTIACFKNYSSMLDEMNG